MTSSPVCSSSTTAPAPHERIRAERGHVGPRRFVARLDHPPPARRDLAHSARSSRERGDVTVAVESTDARGSRRSNSSSISSSCSRSRSCRPPCWRTSHGGPRPRPRSCSSRSSACGRTRASRRRCCTRAGHTRARCWSSSRSCGLFMNAAIAHAFGDGSWAFVIPFLLIQLCRPLVTIAAVSDARCCVSTT